MKKSIYVLALFLISILTSCGGFSIEDVEDQTEATLVESISETLGFESEEIKVLDYSLVQESDNIYNGILKTKINVMKQTWDVEVALDQSSGDFNVKWELINEI